jgi:rifampicin phosphotransferase
MGAAAGSGLYRPGHAELQVVSQSIFIPGSDSPVASLGGKARALECLGSTGILIPEWFVVIPPWVKDSPADELRMDSTLREQIIQAARSAIPGASCVAVRSSAREEDGIEHSFAGQFDSFLSVPLTQIPEHVRAVWQSGFSARVIAYRRAISLTGTMQAPAALVQRMIDADVSGVAFSADPVTGRQDQALVSAVFGLGSALVSGEADADLFTVDQRGAIVSRHIAIKRTAIRMRSNGVQGTTATALAADAGGQPSLTDEQAIEIAALARFTAKLFGMPQDIEWARRDGRLYLLQSRPITTLKSAVDLDSEVRNSSFS